MTQLLTKICEILEGNLKQTRRQESFFLNKAQSNKVQLKFFSYINFFSSKLLKLSTDNSENHIEYCIILMSIIVGVAIFCLKNSPLLPVSAAEFVPNLRPPRLSL